MAGTDTRFFKSFVETLSRTERQMLMLFYAEELTITEIGLVLDLSESRVGSMLDTIRTQARAALSGSPHRARLTTVGASDHSSLSLSLARTERSSSVVVSWVICSSPAAIDRSSRRMIFPERVFGRAVGEADHVRLGDRPDLLADVSSAAGP